MAGFVLTFTADDSFKLRNMTASDGSQVFSVYDYMTQACGYKDTGATARAEFKRVIKDGSANKEEILSICYYVKFPGPGNRNTPCMTVQGLLVLTKCLGDKVSKAFKEEAFNILQRYLDGDTTMHSEIDENLSIGKRKSYEKFAEKVAKRAHFHKNALSDEMPPVSYVYGTKSEAFPNLIKIGRSVNPTARLSSLNTSCAPAPHVIVAVAPTFDSVRDEALAHAFFSSARTEGEFFNVSAEELRTFFTNNITAQYQTELTQHITRVQGGN